MLFAKKIKLILKSVLLFFDLLGYRFFKKKNTIKSYNCLIELFCLTGGYSNLILNNLVKKKLTLSYLHKKDEIDSLNENGFVFKKKYFDEYVINNINNKILELKGKYLGDQYVSKTCEPLNANQPKSATFRYDQNDLINIPEIQNIITDDYFLSLCSSYFKSLPIIDTISLWWSFKSSLPDHNAAQKWHFDMDRLKWLKIFIHLNDINEKNGPHIFIKGTHKNLGIKENILRSGYSRIDDKIINNIYPQDRFEKFLGEKGSIVIEDTRGLHKAEAPTHNPRLILVLQYSTAIFGANTPRIKFPKEKTKQFINLLNSNPEIFENFV
jgi:hypothetical protein